MTNLKLSTLPLCVTYQNQVFRRYLTRRTPGQQIFGIYRGAPVLTRGKLSGNFVLISEDQRFASMGPCWRSLLREMERVQGRYRYRALDAQELISPECAEDPLARIRAAV